MKKMNARLLKPALALFTFLTCLNTYSQDKGPLPGTNARLFELTDYEGTIPFIKLDSTITARKPVLIVLQGSLPIPLLIRYPEGHQFTPFPFATERVTAAYHLVAISKPFVPVEAKIGDLSGDGSLKEMPAEYNRANFLQTYVSQTNKVIEFLRQQGWVDPDKIILFGHSQGGYVALKVANSHPAVSKVGIAGCNPFGRFDQYIRKKRLEELKGEITSEEAQAEIEEYYKWWNYIAANRYDDSKPEGDTEKATFSFSENFLDDILALRIPLYVSYGTKDIGSLGCDYLPIALEYAGKLNYELKAYPGLGHNFEEFDEAGRPDYDKMHWGKAIEDFLNWVEKE